ncbi:unnamed protein product [Candida verbasci]|uniref:Restriction of telomere capping protein 4 n=1 Tax=Candida verbasci TaxID=1227364 RepID=A0A9W4TZC4_9ASCO|nr:unnamed protein product [Candida verbasci]
MSQTSNHYASLDPRRSHSRSSTGSAKGITVLSDSSRASDVRFSPTKNTIKTKTYKRKRIRYPDEPKNKKKMTLKSSLDKRENNNVLENANIKRVNNYNEMNLSSHNEEESDDDEGFKTIDISKINSPTKKLKNTPSPFASKNYDLQIQGLIDISDEEEEDNQIKRKCKDFNVDPTNIIYSILQNSKNKKVEITRKYKSMKNLNLPKIIRSANQLYTKAEKHFVIIPKILSAEEFPSIYYALAKKEASKSLHETMSNNDLKKIDLIKFCGGYYGFKRQSIIGSFIMERYKSELNKYNKNKVIQWWTKQNFATYVLANEIIIRMIMEDLNFTFERAEKFCQLSIDYGTTVADTIDVIDDKTEVNPLNVEDIVIE